MTNKRDELAHVDLKPLKNREKTKSRGVLTTENNFHGTVNFWTDSENAYNLPPR